MRSHYGLLSRLKRLRKALSAETSDRLPGGKADFRPDSDFDPAELARGVKVEMEHTNDPELAKEIAKDHLVESPLYYRELARMEAGFSEKTSRDRNK